MRKTVQIEQQIKKECPYLTLSFEKIEKIAHFIQILIQWNKKINLTSIRDFDSIVTKHILDSLVIFKLQNESTDIWLSNNIKVLDIGSGAGIPGIILSICNPSMTLYSVDKVQKKIIFQDYIKSELGLNNLFPVNEKLENLSSISKYQESFNLVVSRAYSQLKYLLFFGTVFLHKKGNMVLWKGENWQNEYTDISDNLKNVFDKPQRMSYQFDNKKYGGTLLCFKKI